MSSLYNNYTVIIEGLFICQKLRTLLLCGNNITEIQNVDCCRQLWNLDVSGNKVSSYCSLNILLISYKLVCLVAKSVWVVTVSSAWISVFGRK